MKKILLSAAVMLLVLPAVFNANDISAQTVSVNIGTDDKKEKKEQPIVFGEVISGINFLKDFGASSKIFFITQLG